MLSTVAGNDTALTEQRRRWMSVLAQAPRSAIESAAQGLGELPRGQWLRQPETGLAMVRGRIGGTGAKFNLGEVPVTRCAVKLDDGTVGIAWVQGRDTAHAALAARLDALLQDPRRRAALLAQIIEPLAAAQAARRNALSRKAAATKVAFYTLAREAKPTAEQT